MSELARKIGIKSACEVLNVPRSQVYRDRQQSQKSGKKLRPTAAHALSDAEKAEIRELLNSPRFMDQAPRQVYAALLDEGTYLCHWRSMYRILSEHHEVQERRLLRRHPVYKKPELLATAPNQVWSWDITWMRGTRKLEKYPLYTVLDIFSRYVVGWMIAEVESSELAKQLIAETARKQRIQPEQLSLHADNGSPMKGKPLSQLLVDLGISSSHNRPHTSNDNPFSEAQFKTMKYRPDYPDRFAHMDEARQWARSFFDWYNNRHYHSGLNLMTPASVHYGDATAVQQQRQQVMMVAYQAHPERFMHGIPIVKAVPDAVYINPPDILVNLS